tara:strand:- start:584 stop:1066 length:483 start_codon:yes stop_codon:yes gene_type:complete
MLKQSNNIFLISILIFISLTLISAFIIEYALGHEPCKLCVYQRIPYIISILLIFKILFIKTYEKIILFLLFIIFLISLILAFYHFGIEQGFFNESVVCEGNGLEKNLNKEELLKQLKQNTISCKKVNFRIFGLSLAAINTIFSFILSVIFFKLFKNYEKN